MTNAKTEFLDHITTETENHAVRCAIITHQLNYPNEKTFILPISYTSEELDMFLEQMTLYNYLILK
jgi:hypothetical protein